MPFGYSDEFVPIGMPNPKVIPVVQKQAPWETKAISEGVKVPYKIDESNKQLFGIELAKGHPSPFVAACEVFKEDTGAALWASQNWLTDPVVLAARDSYKKTVDAETKLLDKTQLAVKLLNICDEKAPNGAPTLEGKDRIAALKLYSEVMGFKSEVSLSQTNTINEIKVVFVKPTSQQEEEKIVDITPVEEPVTELPSHIKLVSSKR